jgi:hypothetical protein
MNEEVLNFMLSNTCAKTTLDDEYRLFVYDLCCVTMNVEAKCVEETEDDNGNWTFKYHVRKFEIAR